MRPPAPRLSVTAALLALAAGLCALSPAALLVLLPALLLAWVVLLGWFTGERAIALVRRIARRLLRNRRPARAVTPRAALLARATGRGGLLLACSLASRPPPTPA